MTIHDLMTMASEDSTLCRPGGERDQGLSRRTVYARDRVWQRFVEYFEGRRSRGTLELIPGAPSEPEQLLLPHTPHLDYPTALAFLEWLASRCTSPRLSDNMATGTAECLFKDLCSYIAERKNSDIPRRLKADIHVAIHSRFVDKGLLYKGTEPKFITDQKGHQALAEATITHKFLVRDVRLRWQMMAWMAITSQSALRRGSLFPDYSREADRVIRYEHFTLHLLGDGVISLTIRPPHSETTEGRGSEIVLVQCSELYRCPIFWFILLAESDNALPMNSEKLLSLASTPREDVFDIQVLHFARSLPLFRSASTGKVDAAPMVAGVLTADLARLSRIAGFQTTMTAHAFRRMTAIFMRVHGMWSRKPFSSLTEIGNTYADIQLKLAHRLECCVTRTYMNLVWWVIMLRRIADCPSPTDVNAAVWGGPDRTLESLTFHPSVLKK